MEQAVAGVRSTDGLHWVSAWGIVDGDGHEAAAVTVKKARGIFAVPFYSVESIYYHPEMVHRVARRQAMVVGDDGDARAAAALAAALAKVRPEAARLSVKMAEKTIRRTIFANLPTSETILAGAPITIGVETGAVLEGMAASLRAAIDAGNWTAVVTRCPVRESPALDTIAKGVGFPNRTTYEKAVRQLLLDDSEALAFARSLFSDAFQKVSATT